MTGPTAYTPTTDTPITNYIPVLKTASTNEPRFDHDPITGESLGLLIESQRTNLLTYSEDFSDSDWNKGQSSIVSNTIVAPDGTLTADEVDILTDQSFIYQTITVTAETDYTFSWYAKAGTATAHVYGFYDDTNGSFIEREQYNITDGEHVGNNWYRLNKTITTPTGCTSLRTYPLRFSNSDGDVAGSKGTTFLWGAQLEEGEYPTSYIKTEGSEVTRIADVAQITGDNFSEWYRQDEGTVFGEFKAISEIDDGSFDRVFDINDGTNDNSFRLFRSNDIFAFTSRVNGQTNFLAQSGSDFAVDDFGSFAFAVSSDSISAYADGNDLNTETGSNNLSTTVDRLSIGADYNLNRQPSAHIKRLTYYPKRLPNDVLQTLTEE